MPFLEIEATSSKQETDSTRLYYQTVGVGEPIVFIHGWLCNGIFWEDFYTLKDEGYKLIIPDLRGHGKTPIGHKITIETLADDINKLLNHLNIEKTIIIGHSMGGVVTQQFYHTYPGKVKALGLWNTGGQIPFGYGLKGTWYYFKVIIGALGMILAYPFKWLFSYSLTKGWALSFYKKWKNEAYKKLAKYVRAMERRAVVKSAGTLRKFKGIEKLSEIDVPVMLLHGKEDKYITPKIMIKKLEQELPESKSYYIEEAAHFPSNEKPEEVLDCLRDFLETLEKQ